MPFLQLNGVTVPTAKGGSLEYTEIGASRLRSASGVQISDVRALKRRWQMRTPPVSELRSLALMGLIEGQGLYWPASSPSTTPTNGRAPDGAVVQTRSYYAVDGAMSSDENGVPEAPIAGGYSFLRENSGAPNLLTTAVATATSTAGITTSNCTVAVDTTHFWQGNSSIRIDRIGTCNATFTTFAAGALGTRYIVSCYIKVPFANAMTSITLRDNANGDSASSTAVYMGAASGWRRFTVALTTRASGATPALQLSVGATTTADPQGSIYVDAIQLETNAFGAFPTSFQAPGVSRGAGDFNLMNEEFTGPSGMTVSYWQTIPMNMSTFGLEIAAFGTTRTNGNARYWRIGIATANQSRLDYTTGDPGEVIVTGGLVFTGWHHVVGVMRFNPETGETSKAFYFDGVLRGSSSPAAASLPDSITNFQIGGFQSNPGWIKMSDLMVLPYAVDAPTVAAWYAAGVGTRGNLPLLTASGTFVGESSVTVAGSVDRISTVGYYDVAAGAWRNNGRSIEFTLEEV